MKHADAFFAFARERHSIYERRLRGEPGPWTRDAILRDFKFTNVYRELDRTTVWFRENIRNPLNNDDRVLLATVAFRWFNRIETGAILKGDLPNGTKTTDLFRKWDVGYAETRIRNHVPNGPWVSAAYIIKTPDGMDKLSGCLYLIEEFRKNHEAKVLAYCKSKGATLEGTWNLLRECPFLGDFMAYEVVTDLRWTHLLSNAPDINRWANPGPGACRGFSRVEGLDKDHYQRHNRDHRAKVIRGMQNLLAMSKVGKHWPKNWPQWEMREVEHTLCEFDKYERARTGEGRPKQRFYHDGR